MLLKKLKKEEKRAILLPILIPVMNLFLILLPFVLETSLLQQLTTHEITLPSLTKASDNLSVAKKEVILSIFNNYVLLSYDGKDIKIISDANFIANLEKELIKTKMNTPDLKSIQIKVADNVSYQFMIDIIDICKQKNVGLEEIVYIDEVN